MSVRLAFTALALVLLVAPGASAQIAKPPKGETPPPVTAPP